MTKLNKIKTEKSVCLGAGPGYGTDGVKIKTGRLKPTKTGRLKPKVSGKKATTVKKPTTSRTTLKR